MKYLLFANCFPVTGALNSIICDVQRTLYVSLPKVLYKYFNNNTSKIELSKIFKNFERSSHETIKNYFNFLLDNQIITTDNIIGKFPKMSMEWDFPSLISNGILDFNEFDVINCRQYVFCLQKIECLFLQIRVFEKFTFEDLLLLIDVLDNSDMKSVDLIVPFSVIIYEDWLNEIRKQSTITRIVFFNAPFEKEDSIIVFSMRSATLHSCGQILKSSFTFNIKAFTEAHHHNTCLNRKISIDAEGNIKNCPSMSQSFGNIRDTTLEQALAHPDFKKYWNVKKDDITKCKDCEFRYICTDCRAYIDDPEDMYSAPLKCGYDPYTGVWEEWSTNPLKQKAIAYYGMEDLIAGDKENNV